MSMREVGTCRYVDCQQTDLLWEDGYCSDTCREEATGCEVPFCTCAGAGSTLATNDLPSTGDGST
jgi:hypothetical protein